MELDKKVFVWVGYGNVDVFDATSESTLQYVVDAVITNLEDWDLENTITRVMDLLKTRLEDESYTDKLLAYRKAINTLIDSVGVGSHETFEYGTGFKIVSTY